MPNLATIEGRLDLIASINDENNKARKQVSLKQSEVDGGRIQQSVKEYLRGELHLETVKEMPIVSSINVQSAITDKKATVYKKRPDRRFTDVSEEQEEVLNKIYKDMKLDQKLNRMNRNYVYQDQSIGMIVPKDGKLICRIMKMHQIDAIPSDLDPESSDGYIISTFDRTLYIQYDTDKKEVDTATGFKGRLDRSTASQDKHLEVAEKYQYQRYVEKYIVWTKQYNYMMNGLGEILDFETGEPLLAVSPEDMISPLASEGIMPFFEIARDKDFEYFVRPSNAMTDFTVQFNAMLSDLATNIKMNGHAVGLLKCPSEMQPKNLNVGGSSMIVLNTDNPDVDVDFQFVAPNSDIGGISEAIDKFLNYFVTSEGLGGDVVNSKGETEKATSGIDRFLQMLSKIEAHQDDYDAFKDVEQDIYEIIKAWQNVLANSSNLDSKYKVSIPRESEVQVEYFKPEMIQTETEKLSNIEKLIDLGLMSKVKAVMEYYDIDDKEKAEEMLTQVQEDEKMFMPEMGVFNPPSESEDMGLDNDTEDEEESEE
jgi:hypothetical protein